MDEAPIEESTDDRDVVDQSRAYLLALTEAGWGVWERGGTSDQPLVLYAPNDDGLSRAEDYFARANRADRIRRGPLLDVLRWIAFVAGLAWILGTAFYQVRFTLVTTQFRSQNEYEAFSWVAVLSVIAEPIFIVAFGAYVILWLRSRQRS